MRARPRPSFEFYWQRMPAQGLLNQGKSFCVFPPIIPARINFPQEVPVPPGHIRPRLCAIFFYSLDGLTAGRLHDSTFHGNRLDSRSVRFGSSQFSVLSKLSLKYFLMLLTALEDALLAGVLKTSSTPYLPVCRGIQSKLRQLNLIRIIRMLTSRALLRKPARIYPFFRVALPREVQDKKSNEQPSRNPSEKHHNLPNSLSTRPEAIR